MTGSTRRSGFPIWRGLAKRSRVCRLAMVHAADEADAAERAVQGGAGGLPVFWNIRPGGRAAT